MFVAEVVAELHSSLFILHFNDGADEFRVGVAATSQGTVYLMGTGLGEDAVRVLRVDSSAWHDNDTSVGLFHQLL